MDAISDSVFTSLGEKDAPTADPSLLTVILDILAGGWYEIKESITIQEVMRFLLVFLNAHLSLNNSNKVAFIVSGPKYSKFLYPNPAKDYDALVEAKDKTPSPAGDDNSARLVDKEMYRQFRIVDEAVLDELNDFLEEMGTSNLETNKSSLPGALSLALSYTNRMLTVDQSVTTTKGSAFSSSANMASRGGREGISGQSNASALASMQSRLLVVTTRDDENLKYIPIMNSIFAAQKMKLSIDVANMGKRNSSYLQQASDATNGVYLTIDNPQGLIQTLTTAYFIEPAIRPLIVLPTNSNVNYRASCFITGKSVDLGYVCSVCLCIMSKVPETGTCPICGLKFDQRVLSQLRSGPPILRKRRKVARDESDKGEKQQ